MLFPVKPILCILLQIFSLVENYPYNPLSIQYVSPAVFINYSCYKVNLFLSFGSILPMITFMRTFLGKYYITIHFFLSCRSKSILYYLSLNLQLTLLFLQVLFLVVVKEERSVCVRYPIDLLLICIVLIPSNIVFTRSLFNE